TLGNRFSFRGALHISVGCAWELDDMILSFKLAADPLILKRESLDMCCRDVNLSAKNRIVFSQKLFPSIVVEAGRCLVRDGSSHSPSNIRDFLCNVREMTPERGICESELLCKLLNGDGVVLGCAPYSSIAMRTSASEGSWTGRVMIPSDGGQ